MERLAAIHAQLDPLATVGTQLDKSLAQRDSTQSQERQSVTLVQLGTHVPLQLLALSVDSEHSLVRLMLPAIPARMVFNVLTQIKLLYSNVPQELGRLVDKLPVQSAQITGSVTTEILMVLLQTASTHPKALVLQSYVLQDGVATKMLQQDQLSFHAPKDSGQKLVRQLAPLVLQVHSVLFLGRASSLVPKASFKLWLAN